MPDLGWSVGGHHFTSRLIVGTGKYASLDVMRAAHEASGAEMVTVAIRRIHLDDPSGKTLLDHIDRARYRILPNTAGCFTAKDAILTAQLAREALQTDLIKLEVIGDERCTLMRRKRRPPPMRLSKTGSPCCPTLETTPFCASASRRSAAPP